MIMEQYISKSALVAEIERRLKVHMESNHGFSARYDELKDIRSFLDTLKTKEGEEEKVPTWKKVGPDVGQTILYMDGAESYLERFGYRISLNELDKLPKENNL